MSQTRSLRIALMVFDQPVVVEQSVPVGQVQPDELLPFTYALDDAIIGAAIHKVESEGKTISCCKGCSACCRAQPVPVTPTEAHAIALLVDALPEPRKTEIRKRFSNRVERLSAAELFDIYMREVPVTDEEHARATATKYFGLGLSCPFLDDDACSIHFARPFVCRQYLVTTPAELCLDPLKNKVDVVPIPVAPAKAMLHAVEKVMGKTQLTIPLVLALEYDNRHRNELDRAFDSEQLLREWLAALV